EARRGDLEVPAGPRAACVDDAEDGSVGDGLVGAVEQVGDGGVGREVQADAGGAGHGRGGGQVRREGGGAGNEGDDGDSEGDDDALHVIVGSSSFRLTRVTLGDAGRNHGASGYELGRCE